MTTLRFVSAGAAEGLVRRIAALHGVTVEGAFGAVGAMEEALRGGEKPDVVILTRAQVAKLATQAVVTEGSIRDLGAVATSVAVRATDEPPVVADPPALREALLAADAIYFPDPVKATAGKHFLSVLRSLGVADELAPRFRNFPNGMTSMAALAKAGGKPIGCTQATEILSTPGVTLVGPLPPGLDLATTYTAAIRIGTAQGVAASHFIETLAGGASARLRRDLGFA